MKHLSLSKRLKYSRKNNKTKEKIEEEEEESFSSFAHHLFCFV
jgi:hypothetical protein